MMALSHQSKHLYNTVEHVYLSTGASGSALGESFLELSRSKVLNKTRVSIASEQTHANDLFTIPLPLFPVVQF